MAGPRARRNPPPPAGEDELAGEAPTDGSGIPVPTPAVSRVPTLAPAGAPAPAQIPAPGPPVRYTNEDLQRATKLALESFVRG